MPTAHPLDRPIWNALSTLQRPLAEGDALALRFIPDVGPLSALAEDSPAAFDSLSRLVRGEQAAAMFVDRVPSPPAGWQIVHTDTLIQMVCERPRLPATSAPMVELGTADVPEMLALTSLTEPGPFGPRTRELGEYLGIRHEGRLVAMAGERLHLPGHTEISAVCTHPQYRGRGFAQMLMSVLIDRIIARNETPFLHVRAHNTPAIRVYEALGFATRRELALVVVTRAP